MAEKISAKNEINWKKRFFWTGVGALGGFAAYDYFSTCASPEVVDAVANNREAMSPVLETTNQAPEITNISGGIESQVADLNILEAANDDNYALAA